MGEIGIILIKNGAGHAIYTSKIASVSHGNAQIVQGTLQRVQQYSVGNGTATTRNWQQFAFRLRQYGDYSIRHSI